MKKMPLALLIGASLFAHSALANSDNRTISYLTSWGVQAQDVETLAKSSVDTFLLSFGQWDSEGRITTSDSIAAPWQDGSWVAPHYDAWTQLKLAHPEKKIMVAFGGQSYEHIWSALNSDTSREKIAQSLVELLNTGFPVYKFGQQVGTVYLDGIDLDFEKEARLTAEESDNVLKLSQRVRQLLGPDSKKLLSLTTYHVGADPDSCMDNTVFEDCSYIEKDRSKHHGEVLPLLAKSKDVYDFFNVMTYDAGQNFKYQVAMNNYAKAVGDASKIVVGATINSQWGPNGNFLETRENNISRAQWQAEHNYGGFFVWTLGANTHLMSFADQVDYINEMKQAAAEAKPSQSVEDTTAPTVPQKLVATVQGQAIALSWQASSDDKAVTGYSVYRNGVKMTDTTATSWVDNAVSANATHSYTVVAQDAVGNISAASAVAEAKVVKQIVKPATPSLQVSSVNDTTVDLSWQPDANVEIKRYNVYRNSAFVKSVTTPSFQDVNLKPATAYIYAIVAESVEGNLSQYSNMVIAQTLKEPKVEAPKDLVPATPTGLKAVSNTPYSIDISWDAVTNTDIKEYRIYMNDNEHLLGVTTSTSFREDNLHPNEINSYYIEAVSVSGKTSKWASIKAVTMDGVAKVIRPDSPVVTVGSVTSGSVNISWQPVTNTDVTSYDVFRDKMYIGSTDSSTFTDETAKPGSSYAYAVKAKSGKTAQQISLESEAIYVTVPEKDVVENPVQPEVEAPKIIEPAVPTGLQADSVTHNSVNLRWNPVTNVDIKQYYLYRGDQDQPVEGLHRELTSTSFQDKNLEPNTEYRYVLMAESASGKFSDFARVTIKTSADPKVEAPVVEVSGKAFQAGVAYKAGDIVTYEGKQYSARQAHTSAAHWNPADTLSLWLPLEAQAEAKVETKVEAPVVAQAEAPAAEVSADAFQVGVAYKAGDIVTYEGKKYSCRQAHTGAAHWNPASTLSLWLPLQ